MADKKHESSGPCQGCMISEKPILRSILEPCGLNEDKLNFLQLFRDCFNIQIDFDTFESVPSICSMCVRKLTEAWMFRNLVLQTQEQLKFIKLEEEATKCENRDRVILDNLEIIIEPLFEIEPMNEEGILSGLKNCKQVNQEKGEISRKAFIKSEPAGTNEEKHIRQNKKNKQKKSSKTICKQKTDSCSKKNTKNKDFNENNEPYLKKESLSSKLKRLKDLENSGEQYFTRDVANCSKFDSEIQVNYHQNIKPLYKIQPTLSYESISRNVKPTNVADFDENYSNIEARNYGIKSDSKDCNFCEKQFKNHSTLMQHLSEHFPNYICSLCGKTFFTKKQYEQHQTFHKNEHVNCKICLKQLKKVSLKDHMIQIHDVRNRKYQCDICKFEFQLRNALKNHILRVHEKAKNVYCSICNRGFYGNEDLQKHMTRHTGIRDFVCQVCGKAFLKKFTLDQHMKIHSDIKDFVCSLCGAAFTYKCSLKGHLRTHHPGLDIGGS